MTVEEIRKSAEPKHECNCGEWKRRLAELKDENAKLTLQLQFLRSDYDNLMETVDELNDENANLRGQVKALKFAIKQLAKR